MRPPVKCGPGYRDGESQEQGMARRDREFKQRTAKWIAEIRKQEAAKLDQARKLIEERLGEYDDRPL